MGWKIRLALLCDTLVVWLLGVLAQHYRDPVRVSPRDAIEPTADSRRSRGSRRLTVLDTRSHRTAEAGRHAATRSNRWPWTSGFV